MTGESKEEGVHEIVFPPNLSRAYCLIRRYGRRASAIEEVMNDKEVWGDLCRDCCGVMERQKDQAEAVIYALQQALAIPCSCYIDPVTRRPRLLTSKELIDGKCRRCGARLVNDMGVTQ